MQGLWELGPMVGSLVSLYCCKRLVLDGVTQSPRKYSGNTLALKQIKQMARIDALAAIFCVLVVLPQLIPIVKPVGTGFCSIWRYVAWFPFRCSLASSLLLELHLGFGIVAEHFALANLYRFLKRTVRLPCIVGAIVCMVEITISTVFMELKYEVETKSCSYISDPDQWSDTPLIIVLATFTIAVNLLAYFLILAHRCFKPIHTTPHMYVKLLRCSFALLVTWAPRWILQHYDLEKGGVVLLWASNPYQMLSASFVSLNGAFNMWCYASDLCSAGMTQRLSRLRHMCRMQVRCRAGSTGELNGALSETPQSDAHTTDGHLDIHVTNLNEERLESINSGARVKEARFDTPRSSKWAHSFGLNLARPDSVKSAGLADDSCMDTSHPMNRTHTVRSLVAADWGMDSSGTRSDSVKSVKFAEEDRLDRVVISCTPACQTLLPDNLTLKSNSTRSDSMASGTHSEKLHSTTPVADAKWVHTPAVASWHMRQSLIDDVYKTELDSRKWVHTFEDPQPTSLG